MQPQYSFSVCRQTPLTTQALASLPLTATHNAGLHHIEPVGGSS